MTTIEIDRIRARYHEVDPASVMVLDGALRDLADAVLEDELAAVDLGGGLLPAADGRAHAICVDELAVAVDLDLTRSRRSVAGAWAGAILDALRARIGADDILPGEVVVYRREVDALVDLVTGVAGGDRHRVWAWHQVGLVPRSVAWPAPADVADAVIARPPMIPAVMTVAGAAARAMFGPDELVRIARALGPIVPAPPDPPVPDGAVPDPLASDAGRRAATVADLVASVVELTSVVPAPVWAAVADPRDRRALAVLTLAVVRPHLVGDAAVLAAVLGRVDVELGASGAAPSAAGATRRDAAPPPEDAGTEGAHESEAGGGGEAARPGDEDAARSDERTLPTVASPWGGVWFLVHPYRELDLLAELGAGPLAGVDPIDALTAITVAITAAPGDDPSVRGLVGRRDDDPADLWVPDTAVERDEVGRWAETVRGWVVERAQGRIDDLDRVWRRDVTIATNPGWTEVTFALDDVDLGVRLAGLDLDPGFVWWLGAVVGFRYV